MRSFLLRVALWAIFGGVAFLAVFVWEVGPVWLFAIMVGVMASLSFLMFFFLAIATHSRSRIRPQAKYEIIHPARDVIPDEFWDRVLETIDVLAPCGFKLRGHFRMGERVSGTVSYVTLLENTTERDIGKLVVVFVRSKKPARTHTTLVLHSEFVDGTELVTANNQMLSNLPSPKARLTIWLPHVHEASELYHFHRQAARALIREEKRWTPIIDPVDYLEKFSVGEIARWVKLGYYKPDPKNEMLRLTWRGAFQTSWKLIPPMKGLYEALRKHRTNKLLRKIQD
jgi:hypothetical protein